MNTRSNHTVNNYVNQQANGCKFHQFSSEQKRRISMRGMCANINHDKGHGVKLYQHEWATHGQCFERLMGYDESGYFRTACSLAYQAMDKAGCSSMKFGTAPQGNNSNLPNQCQTATLISQQMKRAGMAVHYTSQKTGEIQIKMWYRKVNGKYRFVWRP